MEKDYTDALLGDIQKAAYKVAKRVVPRASRTGEMLAASLKSHCNSPQKVLNLKTISNE